MQHDHKTTDTSKRFGNVSRYVFFGFVAIALYFLIAEHRAHVIPFLPFLLLAACPLMHLFHRHGHHGGGDEASRQRPSPDSPSPPKSGTEPHQH